MQKALSSLFVLSGLFLAFSGVVAHADGPNMQDMYSKMGFSWGGGADSGSHGQRSGNPGTKHQYDQSGGSGPQTGDNGGQGQGTHTCSHSGGADGSQQPPSWQQGSAGSIRGGLDLPPPDSSTPPPATTTTPGV